jgi:hypothetical protein
MDLSTLPPEQKLALRKRLWAAYLPTFAMDVLRGPPEYNHKFLLGRHHLEWGDAVRDNRRVLAQAARDHGKSHFFCFAYPLWMAMCRAPGRTGYIFSATDQQAREHLDKIRQELLGGGEHGEANPMLAELLPLKKDSARTIRFANGSEIRARGFGSRVRGGHPYWVVCDDILNDDHIWSETVRKKGNDYYLSAIEPMPIPGGQVVVVGTPFHAEDLYSVLHDGGVYHVMKHPAVDHNDQPLWPERYTVKDLEVRKRVLGSTLRWSREYLCEPISDDSSLFPSHLWDQGEIKQAYSMGLPKSHWDGFGMYMGVDLALSASAAADFFVCFVLAVDPHDGTRWVVDITKHKGLGYQAQVDQIISMSKKYDCDFVFVEANQYQRVISDMVVRTSDAPIKAFYTTGRGGASTRRRGMTGSYSANKNSLDRGVPGLRMLVENHKIRIPWAADTREQTQYWLSEMTSFGIVNGKMQGVGAHDDTVMAFWMADQAAHVGGAFSISFGEVLSEQKPRGPVNPGTEVEDDTPDFFGEESYGSGPLRLLKGGKPWV